MNTKICDNENLSKKEIAFKVYNILRLLGIKTSNNGAKLIYFSVLIALYSNQDFLNLKSIYSVINAKYKNTTEFQIRRSIQYAIDSRNVKKSKENFEKIFGFEYDEYIFTNKNFIEEIIQKLNLYN